MLLGNSWFRDGRAEAQARWPGSNFRLSENVPHARETVLKKLKVDRIVGLDPF